MTVEKCNVPRVSAAEPRFTKNPYFWDAYRAPVTRSNASVTDIFVAVFAHHPVWIKALLIARNGMASLCGLDVPTRAEILHPQFKASYRVGEKIGVWPIYALTETELVAGRNNRHLDFRVSVQRGRDEGAPSVVVSTLCVVHNLFGKVYLFFIVPFHKWGVQRLIANAIASGRL